MSKLQDYYRLFDMFKGKLTDEQKKVLEGLEDQLITEEILPAISESVAPVLGNLRRNLTLVVDYDPEGGITVKTTRGEVVVKEHTAKKYEIPSTKKVVKVAEAGQHQEAKKPSVTGVIPDTARKQEWKANKRSPATGLCVWLPDGDFIQARRANITMAQAIEKAGAEAVANLHIAHDGDYLVSKTRHQKYNSQQQPLSHGYLLNTHSGTITKKSQLDYISAALHLGWKVEIIK